MLKISVLVLLLLSLSQVIFPEDNLSLSIKQDYNNILKLKSKDFDADLNQNSTKLNFMWNKDLLTVGVSLIKNYSIIDVTVLNTDILYPIEVESDKIFSKSEFLYPIFYLGIDKTWLQFAIKDDLEVEFNLIVPLSKYIDIGINQEIIHPLNISIDILGSYNLLLNPCFTKTSVFFDIKSSFMKFGGSLSSISLENKVSLDIKDSINLRLLADSNYAYNSYIGYTSDLFNMTATRSYARFRFEENPIYLFKDRTLWAGTNDDSKYETSTTTLLSTFRNLSISLFHSDYKIEPPTFFLKTSAFIYGPLAYRHYDFFIPDTVIYNTGGEISYTSSFSRLSSIITLKYSRYYTDLKSIDYGYKEYIWAIFSPALLSISPLLNLPLGYDHINLVDLNLNSIFNITKHISIIGTVNQTIPFFDNIISNNSNASIDTANTTNNSISGGTYLSLEIKFEL